jgi:hypothetical protein
MIKSIITMAIFSFIHFSSFAQSDCLIKYEYDASGNRVKRYFICGVQDTIIDSPNPGPGAKLANQSSKTTIQFVVSPNPNNGNFNVSSTAKYGTELQVQIYNLQGAMLKSQSYIVSKNSCYVTNNLSAGNYVVKITNNQNNQNNQIFTTIISVSNN